jgi:nitrogen fixation-related uncharacterized protein
MGTVVSSGMLLTAAAGLLALALILLFLWAIYKRGGIDDLVRAAKAISGLLNRKR